MPQRLISLSRLAAVLGLLSLVALCAAPASEAATSWGEIGHFANNSGELLNSEAAFGVDPEDGSAWVVDTVQVGTEGNEQFRLQKFEKTGGTWKVAASVDFGQVETEFKGEPVEHEVEGVAFDKEKKRAYVLVSEEAVKGSNKEAQVASELWAFSTTTSGGKISFAPETSNGVLVERTEEAYKEPLGQKKFSPNDTEKKAALAKPGGIAVDQSTHQILIAGTDAKEQPALWAVSSGGTIEKAWEQSVKYAPEEEFENCECLNSPVVTSAGKILALGESIEEVYEIPAGLKPGESAKRAFWMPTSRFACERLAEEAQKVSGVETCPYVEKLTELDPGKLRGGEMAVGPEGNVLIHAKIPNAAHEGSLFGGAMVLSQALQEDGWTGGGSSATASQACSVDETGENGGGAALIGGGLLTGKAGEGETVFMFERGERNSDAATKVLELGPGGSTAECPQAQATAPTASSSGTPLTSFPISATVSFSSKMTQANALSTEWEFEPGVTQTTGRQQETTLVEHKFAHEGKHVVKEVIHTDDLATPIVEKHVEITITGPPKVEKEKATQEGATTFALSGEVNPNGQLATCEFEYGLASEAFGSAGIKKKPCPESPIEEPFTETIKAEALTPGKEYHFRIVAKSGATTVDGEEQKFLVTEAGAPKAETGVASEVGSSKATLSGKVDPEGVETTCEFEYGTTLPSTSKAPCVPAPGKGAAFVSLSATVEALAPGTSYKYRLVAKNSSGKEAKGAEATFKTLEAAAKPSVEALPVSGALQSEATLKANVDPNGEATSCEFEYGTTLPGTKVPCPTAPGTGRSNIEEAVTVKGLKAGTPYHFKVVAKNAIGTGESEQAFATLAEAPPEAQTLAASAVAKTTATVTGKVDPKGGGAITKCVFVYGTTTSYGKEARCTSEPDNVDEAVSVSTSLSSLGAGTVYHYRLLVENAAGKKAEGADAELSTEKEASPVCTVNCGGGGGGGGGGGTTTTSSTPPPSQGVQPFKEASPTVTIAGTALTVAGNGTFSVKLSCPAGETQCAGTITLKTLTAVAASVAHAAKAKKAILTLASGSFTIAGGKLKVLSLHLTTKAKALLAKLHTVRARVTISSRNPQGGTHTTTAVVTLKAAKKHH